jgi:hypothetical protein
MTTAIECKHDEFCDYLGPRHLGYCRVCGRTMEYGGDGEKPRDVTEEFGGNCPFPYPPDGRMAGAVTIPAGTNTEGGLPKRGNWDISPEQRHRAQLRGNESRVAGLAALRTMQPHQRGNFERARWYEDHREAIVADVKVLGPTEARKKWNIPSSTFSHHLRVWGVLPPGAKLANRPKAKPAPKRPRPQNDAWQRHRHFSAHLAEIEADLRAIGPAETCRKWGMEQRWLERRFETLASRRLWRDGLAGERAAAEQAPDAPASTGPDGHTLPAWSETWPPEVKVAWLRAMGDITVAEVLRDNRAAAAA